VDPDLRSVEWFARESESFRSADGSQLLGITSAELTAQIAWPA
jgi:hypothetical protein